MQKKVLQSQSEKNTADYSNKKPYNGIAPQEDEVLVPLLAFGLVRSNADANKSGLAKPNELLITDNLETWHLGGRTILVAFAPVPADAAEVSIKVFWEDVNAYIEETRKKRCLISDGKGGLMRCPKCNDCNLCDDKDNQNNLYSRTVSLDKMQEAMDEDRESGWDPTGTTASEDMAMLLILINELIDDVAAVYPEADVVLHMLMDGYQVKEILEQVNLGRSKSQSYEYVKKMQKLAKELWFKNYK